MKKKMRIERVLVILLMVVILVFIFYNVETEVASQTIVIDIVDEPVDENQVKSIESSEEVIEVENFTLPDVEYFGGDSKEKFTIISRIYNSTIYLKTPTDHKIPLHGPFHPEGPGKYVVSVYKDNKVVFEETLFIKDVLMNFHDTQLERDYDTNQIFFVTREPIKKVVKRYGLELNFTLISEAENQYSYVMDMEDESGIYDFYGWNYWLFSKSVDFIAPDVSIKSKVLHNPSLIKIFNMSKVDVVIRDSNRSYDGFGFVYDDGFISTLFIPSRKGKHFLEVYFDNILVKNQSFFVNEKMDMVVSGWNISLLNASYGAYDLYINSIKDDWFVVESDVSRNYSNLGLSGVLKIMLEANRTGYYQEEWLKIE